MTTPRRGKASCASSVSSPTPRKVARLRESLDGEGVYGDNLRVHRGSFRRLEYTDYLFQLVVVDPALGFGHDDDSIDELFRLLRPMAARRWSTSRRRVQRRRFWIAGVGSVPSNTPRCWPWTRWVALGSASSEDRSLAEVSGPTCTASRATRPTAVINTSEGRWELLWFGRPGPREMLNRHHHPTAPLSVGGRLFIPANDRLFAIDIYNGTRYWEIDLPLSNRLRADLTGNIFAASRDTLYMAIEESVFGSICRPEQGRRHSRSRSSSKASSANGATRRWPAIF